MNYLIVCRVYVINHFIVIFDYHLLPKPCYRIVANSLQVAHREKAILQSFVFLEKYGSLRRCEQEVTYNFGRACHQLGLNHLVRTLQTLNPKP